MSFDDPDATNPFSVGGDTSPFPEKRMKVPGVPALQRASEAVIQPEIKITITYPFAEEGRDLTNPFPKDTVEAKLLQFVAGTLNKQFAYFVKKNNETNVFVPLDSYTAARKQAQYYTLQMLRRNIPIEQVEKILIRDERVFIPYGALVAQIMRTNAEQYKGEKYVTTYMIQRDSKEVNRLFGNLQYAIRKYI